MANEHMTTHQHLRVHKTKTHTGWAIRDGIAGGIVAGIVFALAQILTSWILYGEPLQILRFMASLFIQQTPETITTASAWVVGGLLHLAISAVWGVITALIIVSSSALYKTRGRIVAFSAFMGFVAWILMNYIIAPAADTPWFRTQTNAFFQFLWYTFAYGAFLGWYLDATPPKDEVSIR